jgi:NAD(P)-dependent dehydrogenase (short-subunit alcohol dehydrogenase family)
MSFDGRVVMITGAAGNLGRAVASAFAARGASLALLDISTAVLDAAYPERDGKRTVLLPTDLLDGESVKRAAATVMQRWGRIDALCNIAGGFRMGTPVHETPGATWKLMLDLNTGTLINAAQAVVPHMLAARSGRIVNIGSMAALSASAQMGAYAASKSMVVRLTEAMSAELREQGINVNCVLPSVIDTPQNRTDMPSADPNRWVSPHDLAQVLLFLCSDAARAIHGAAIPVTNLS